MFGYSLLKVIKMSVAITSSELVILIVGCAVAFAVSLVVIKFLMSYIKKHDFQVFGVYRIILGIAVIAYLHWLHKAIYILEEKKWKYRKL